MTIPKDKLDMQYGGRNLILASMDVGNIGEKEAIEARLFNIGGVILPFLGYRKHIVQK